VIFFIRVGGSKARWIIKEKKNLFSSSCHLSPDCSVVVDSVVNMLSSCKLSCYVITNRRLPVYVNSFMYRDHFKNYFVDFLSALFVGNIIMSNSLKIIAILRVYGFHCTVVQKIIHTLNTHFLKDKLPMKIRINTRRLQYSSY